MNQNERKKLIGLDDVLLDGKTVLVRVDFNVAVGEDNKVDGFEDYRIVAAIPTIEELLQRRCKVILLTHLGRPGEEEGNFDLAPIRRRIEELLGEEVKTLKTLSGPEVDAVVAGMEPGSLVMMPNVRTDEREVNASMSLAEDLAGTAEVYVNEAFSVSHRDHASVSLLPTLLPSCAGRRTVLEHEVLTALSSDPARPYVAIVSGAKVHTKVELMDKLLEQVDQLCVGGKIANTFLSVKNYCADTDCEDEDMEAAKKIIQKAGDKLVLPVDVVIGPKGKEENTVETVSVDKVPEGVGGVWDLGPKTIELYLSYCKKAKTVMWNGPVGKFEDDRYAAGTHSLAEGLSEVEARVVVGGGDTAYALETMRLIKKFDHVSVGGGAMLAILEKGQMPGLEPLIKT
jgi:phosphoglycerate kinase